MVDAKVLNTFGLCPCGFESHLRHQQCGRRSWLGELGTRRYEGRGLVLIGAIESDVRGCRSGGMVDAKVSKTFGLGPCGFDSHLRHQRIGGSDWWF